MILHLHKKVKKKHTVKKTVCQENKNRIYPSNDIPRLNINFKPTEKNKNKKYECFMHSLKKR